MIVKVTRKGPPGLHHTEDGWPWCHNCTHISCVLHNKHSQKRQCCSPNKYICTKYTYLVPSIFNYICDAFKDHRE